MLSLFPQILFLAPFSALVIRLALAVVFALSSWRHITGTMGLRTFALIEVAVAAGLIAGVWTQALALLAATLIILGLLVPRVSVAQKATALLALVLCASLLVTGAGAIAFDLPL